MPVIRTPSLSEPRAFAGEDTVPEAQAKPSIPDLKATGQVEQLPPRTRLVDADGKRLGENEEDAVRNVVVQRFQDLMTEQQKTEANRKADRAAREAEDAEDSPEDD
jgi:50S ribosomal subunit-associated GTPase HflX